MQSGLHRAFIRALGWMIGVFASIVSVVLLLVVAYLLFFDYSEQLRVRLEQELTRLSGAPAKIGSIALDLPRFAFELRNIEVRSAEGDLSEPPALEIERVWGKLQLGEILNLRLHWNELRIDGLSLQLVEREGVGVRLPRAAPASPLTTAGIAFAADHVTLDNAFIVVSNERVPWELEADNLSLTLDRAAFGGGYTGRLVYDRGRLKVKGREVTEAAVAVDFELDGRDLLVRDARVAIDEGVLSGTGKLSFAGGIRGRFDVSAEADAATLATVVLGAPEAPPVQGRIAFRGLLDIEPESRQLSGTVTLGEGRVRGVAVADWRGEVFWDRSLLQISYAEGRIAEGRAKLQLHQALPVEEHPAALDVELSDVSLAGLVEGARGRFCPVASSVSGSASLTFSASAPEEVDGAFEAVGASPPLPEPEREALSFRARGRLSGGDLEIEQMDATTDTLEVALSGLYPREGSATLAVEVDSSDLEATDRLQLQIRRLVRSDEEPDPRLLGIRGRGHARGRLTSRLPHLAYDGELTAEELFYQGLRLEAVRARGTISRERLTFEDLVARSGRGAVAGRGGLSLGGPLAERPFELELSLSSWPAEDVARALGASLPIGGEISGDFSVSRIASGLKGTAVFGLSSGALGDRAIGDAQVRATLSGSRLVVDSLTVARGEARLEGKLALDLDGHGLEGSLATRRFPLEDLLPGVELGGQFEARIDLGGRIEAPRASVSGRGRGVRLSGVELGEAFLSGELADGTLDLHASFEREVSELVVEATCRFEGDYPMSGKLVWRQLDARPWILGGEASDTLRIISDGEASFRGAARGEDFFESFDLDAGVSEITVESEGLRFGSAAPVELTLSGGRLDVASLELVQGASRVALAGGLDLRARALDFEATGILDLQLLESLYPGLETTGAVDVAARVTGEWARPSLTGHADFRGGSLRLRGFPQALGGLRGRLVFDNRTVRVADLRGVFGSGPVTISGTVLLEGLEPGTTDLRLRGRDVRLRYPEGLVATLDADLALVGNGDERVLSGSVSLADAVWSREYDLVSGILSDRDAARLFEEFEGEGLIERVRLDVSIEAPNTLRLRNSIAEIDASASLELGGNVREPILLGRSEARRGDVYFLGQRYEILSGKVDFVDPTKIEPFIDLVAETRVRSYRVELRLTGTPDRFFPELSSDPPLRTVDILRLLAGASERDIGLLGNEEEELAGVGVASLLTERLTQEVGRRAERLFGLDRFAIDPFLIGQFANPTARISLGKQITRDLIINYSTNLNATTEAIILIEYTPEGPISWILSRSEEGDVGIDVKFRRSF